MTDLYFEYIDNNIYNLSSIDLQNLKLYLNQHNEPLINQVTNEEEKSIDYYVNQILKENSQSLISPSIEDDNYGEFSLDVSVCGMPKNKQLPVPHENFSLTKGYFGDDSGFILENEENIFLGISDGVSGNKMYGHDPRLFSESLMRNCSNLADTEKYSSTQLKRLLCDAYDCVQNEKCFGSATACILGIDCQSGRLYSVNIGDSGYVIIRQGSIVFRSQSQEMNGDAPRQLDVYPWTSSLKQLGIDYTKISNLDAICQTFDLQLNDIIILSTDGLFDNVPDYLIEKILLKNPSLKHAATELVNQAVRHYVKPDDILVIMARVTDDQSE